MISSWTTISGHLQGDVSYSLRKSVVTDTYVDIELTAFSEKWQEFDLALEYRKDERQAWQTNASITQTTANYLDGNKLFGFTASKDGEVHLIRWQYSDNSYLFSQSAQIRLRPLPRIRTFSQANSNHPIVELYSKGRVNFIGQSRHDCIGIDNNGNYMCVGSDVFYIIESLDVEEFSSSSESSFSSDSSLSSSSSSSQSSSSSSSQSSSSSSSQSSSSSSSSSSSGAAGIGFMVIEGLADPFKVS